MPDSARFAVSGPLRQPLAACVLALASLPIFAAAADLKVAATAPRFRVEETTIAQIQQAIVTHHCKPPAGPLSNQVAATAAPISYALSQSSK